MTLREIVIAVAILSLLMGLRFYQLTRPEQFCSGFLPGMVKAEVENGIIPPKGTYSYDVYIRCCSK